MFSNLIFEFECEEKNIKEIENRLKHLLTTPKGTMPMDRKYGIDFSSFIDKPMEVIQNEYATAVIDCVDAYEDELEVISVSLTEISISEVQAVITLRKKEAELS